jgi:hypothetical protein
MILSLLFLFSASLTFAVTKGHKHKKKPVTYALTVAAIRPPNDGETFMRVSFLQSARFYKLPLDADPAYLKSLNESVKTHTPVMVERASEESDVIVSVKKPK